MCVMRPLGNVVSETGEGGGVGVCNALDKEV